MTLLETVVEVTADDSWPFWLHTLIGIVLGACAPWLIKHGYRVTVKPKVAKVAKATTSGGALLLATTLSGCALFESTSKSWVEADRATYDLIAPEYGAYVEADPKLTDLQKKLRKSAIETWALRLKTNEKAVE